MNDSLGASDRRDRPDRLCVIRTSRPLEERGWSRRFLCAPDRVDEAVELYEEMGFEVRIEKPDPSTFDDGCRDCSDEVCKSHVLIYTRTRGGEA